jgi:hypothetical protein
MKILYPLKNKLSRFVLFTSLFLVTLSYAQPPGFEDDWDNQPGGGDEAPINDWILLSSIVAIGYGFYAIKKKSAVKA